MFFLLDNHKFGTVQGWPKRQGDLISEVTVNRGPSVYQWHSVIFRYFMYPIDFNNLTTQLWTSEISNWSDRWIKSSFSLYDAHNAPGMYKCGMVNTNITWFIRWNKQNNSSEDLYILWKSDVLILQHKHTCGKSMQLTRRTLMSGTNEP